MVPELCFRLATFASPQTRNIRFTLAPQSKDYSVVLLLYHIIGSQQGFPHGSLEFFFMSTLMIGFTTITIFLCTSTIIGLPQ